MKVEFVLGRDKAERHGYTMDTIYHIIKKTFAERNLPCVFDGDILAFRDNGDASDCANMWAIIMTLLRTEWFVQVADSCIWYEDDGSEEDVLSQAWKVRRPGDRR